MISRKFLKAELKSHSQNHIQDVVSWLLKSYPKKAALIPLSFGTKCEEDTMILTGSIPGTVRFHPNIESNSFSMFGGGFFIAKIEKKECP